ncbi:MAG TPA: hypothetical protein VGO93_00635 [Candidatus Xenobia bacterium]|jgi:hypothetical protein
MSLGIRLADDVFIPPLAGDLASFRRWTTSLEFPETGRIDYLQGVLEVDMTAEELQIHGTRSSKSLPVSPIRVIGKHIPCFHASRLPVG